MVLLQGAFGAQYARIGRPAASERLRKHVLQRTSLLARSSGAQSTDTPTNSGSLPDDLVLGDVRVVLVAPKGEQNIGAVCRVCANFEAPDLYIVAPRCV